MRSRCHTGCTSGPTDCSQATHPERHHRGGTAGLYIIGIGPGDAAHLSHRACEVLKNVDTVVGYTTYIDLIRPLIEGKTIVSTPMMKEVERVEKAIQATLEGRSCALVSSGDAGIYAMAGLVFEMAAQLELRLVPSTSVADQPAGPKRLRVEVVPGIPALCAGAALLGAPLTHDFAAISLSDLLTPWDLIEKRLQAAAQADFVLVLYNPRSKRRHWQLPRAQEILLTHRKADTPVGVVQRAMRSGQSVTITTLADLHLAAVDMQTTVFIGSSATRRMDDFMVTPRGYASKYQLAK